MAQGAHGARLCFDAAACLPVRYPGYECGLCAPACPVSALIIADGAPELRGECIGCGQCATVCPTAAVRVDGFALPAACPADGESIPVDCWRVPLSESPRGALRVPCLAGIDTGWLLALFDLADERPIHLLDRGECGGCPVGAGMGALRAALSEVRILLFECGISIDVLPELTFQPIHQPQSLKKHAGPSQVFLGPQGGERREAAFSGGALSPSIPTSAAALPMDRRSFFRGLIGGVARGADDIKFAAAQDEAISLRHAAQPIGRMRAVTSLSSIAARHGRGVPSRALPRLSLADCSAHGVCAGVCPTRALHRHESGATAELRFQAALCIACGQCVRACPDRAIRMSSAGGESVVEVLARWIAHECAACGEPFFGASGDLCPGCSKGVNLQQGMAALFRPSA
ncbi:MAG: 4Fe-4S binding protein [Sulfuritalea sp.]|nr:4Fe-4S binding protein [Sulfuritalea sp.]